MNVTAVVAVLFGLCVSCTASFAQSTEEKLEKAQQSLDGIQRRLPQLATLGDELATELKSYARKLELAQLDLAQANRAAADAMTVLRQSKAEHEAAPSQDTDRLLKTTEHGYLMAERGVKNRSKRVERIQGKYQQLLQSNERLEQKKKTLSNQINTYQVTIKGLKRTLKSQAEREKQEAIVAARSAQLKAEEEARLNRKVVEQLSSEKSKDVAVVRQTMAQVGAESNAKAEDIQRVKALSDLSPEDQLMKAEAKKMLAAVNKEIANKPGRRPLYKRLTLKGQSLVTVPFDFIGANYYRAQARVSSGPQFFEVSKNRFKRELPQADDGQLYIFIYQAKSASRGDLQYYKKSLLED